MNDDRGEKLKLAEALGQWSRGRISRREFVRTAVLAGFGACLPSLAGCRRPPVDPSRPIAAGNSAEPGSGSGGSEQRRFLREMGRRFGGTKLVVVGEDTPPSQATRKIMFEEFIPLTGIEVEWELLPLDRVLAKISSDTARQVGGHDIFYVDQQWVARFAGDFVEPTSLFEREDLAFPDYQFEDILPELVKDVATYQGRLVGIPYDIPIRIMIYRKDIFDRLGLLPPDTMPEFLEAARRINHELYPQIHGATGMWKSGHFAVYGDYAGLLWAHGGSIFLKNGDCAVADEQGIAALEYIRALSNYMPPAVTTWDWNGEAQSFARGRAAIMLQSGEALAMINDPKRSRVAGRVGLAPCPAQVRLRPAGECGFSEIPGTSRQGGSLLCLSRYSRNIDPAWVFLQWATSKDVTTRACIMGGGSTPIRASNYTDPRILEHSRMPDGVTAHYPITLDAIRHRMGSDPKLPSFPKLALEGFAVELGKFTTGQQNVAETARAMERAARLQTAQ